MHRSRSRARIAVALFAAGACAALVGCAGGRGPSEPMLFRGSTEPEVLQALAAFTEMLGQPNNSTALGSQSSGHRFINWDAIGAAFTNTNTFPGNFFNANSTRGLIMSTPGTGFRVSGNNFTDVNPTYAGQFGAFSIAKTFSPVGSNILDLTFQVPGTLGTNAGVHGFGAVFSDVDTATSTTMEYFDEGGRSLGVFAVPAASTTRRTSFLGVHFPDNIVSRVRINLGTAAIGAGVNDISTLGGTQDLVILDDFIYSEPRPIF